jgi:hypothetical protein
MPGELIHVQNGRATISDAVIRVADALNPLGAAANIVATIGACVIEIGRFKTQSKELVRRHTLASDVIRTRQGVIIGLFEQRARDSTHMQVSLEDLRWSLRTMTLHACDMSASADERQVTHGTVTVLSGQIVHAHLEAGNSLVRLSDSLRLGDTEAAITAWRVLES